MIDKKKVLRQTEEAAQRSGRLRFLKKNATTNLRIFEYEDEDGATVFAQPLVEHRRQGEGGKGLGVCRQEVFGKPCAYCAANVLATEKGAGYVFISRTRYVVNAVDMDNEPKNVRLWVLPTSVFSDIAEYALDEEWSDILEPKKGYGLAIKKTGQGLDTAYSMKIHRKSYPVGKDVTDQIVNPLEGLRDPGLEAQCAELGVEASDLFDSTELEELKKQSNSKSKKDKKADKPSETPTRTPSDIDEPFMVGQAVQYEDEDGVCHVVKVEDDIITIEDSNGDEYDATADQLTIIEESSNDDFEVGDLVNYDNEDGNCKVVKILSDTEVTIEDVDGDEYDVEVEKLVKVEEKKAKKTNKGKSTKPAKTGEDSPKCFGDPNLFDADDDECKNCSFNNDCSAIVDLNAAGVGNVREATKKSGGKRDADDVLSSILGR